jgi:hypothetical protein
MHDPFTRNLLKPMQTALFPSREKPYTGFPNPALVPARARNYVRLQEVIFRRDHLSIGQPKEMWWSCMPHTIDFEITPEEAQRIPVFERTADMEAYLERMVAFESNCKIGRS